MGDVKDAIKGDGPKSGAWSRFKDRRRKRAADAAVDTDADDGIDDDVDYDDEESHDDDVDDDKIQNLLDGARVMREEASRLTVLKDQDTDDEGPDARPENIRKATSLRIVHSLTVAIERLLDEY